MKLTLNLKKKTELGFVTIDHQTLKFLLFNLNNF